MKSIFSINKDLSENILNLWQRTKKILLMNQRT